MFHSVLDCYISAGEAYIGRQAVTSTGKACAPWGNAPNTTVAANVSGESDNHNFCRNPGGIKDRPWCYTNVSSADWEFCRIEKCKEGEREKNQRQNAN